MQKKLLLKTDELDQTINQLIAIRDGLHHVIAYFETSYIECPDFNEILDC